MGEPEATNASNCSPVVRTVLSPGASAWIAGSAAANAGPTTSTLAPQSCTMRPISAGVRRKFTGAIAAPILAHPTITSKNSGLFRSR